MGDAIITAPVGTATASAIAPIIYVIPKHLTVDAPTATATAGGIAPVTVPTNVKSISLHPATAILEPNEKLIVSETITPSSATFPGVTWSTNNPAVATVVNGIVTSVTGGTATITATSKDPARPTVKGTCVITVAESVAEPFVALKVINKDLVTEEYTINNTDIIYLVIEKELGGNQSLFFSLPYTSAAVAEITPGRYIECEKQLYYIEHIKSKRGADGNPVLDVQATHIFFEIEKRQANTDFAGYSTILPLLQGLLAQYGITVVGTNPTSHLYNTTRYVSYSAGASVLNCLKAIFQPYFASFRVDNLKLIIIPDVGEITTAGVSFRYAVNNRAINKDADYSDIITKLYAEGAKDITYTANAPAEIKALYRQEREHTMGFIGVSVQADLEFLANRYLAHKQLPLTTYTLSVAELKHISNIADLYPGDTFNIQLGRLVTVYDEEFGLDVQSVIQRYTYRPLEPAEVSTVVIGDLKPYDITFTEPDRTGKHIDDGDGDGVDPREHCDPLFGIISTDDPNPEIGGEDCLWFKYTEST